MKKRFTILFFCVLTATQIFANKSDQSTIQTAESVYAFAHEMSVSDKENLDQQINQLSEKEKATLLKLAVADIQHARASGLSDPSPALFILAILLPPVAVGIYTDWGTPTLWNLLFTLFAWVPGVVHAFYILLR